MWKSECNITKLQKIEQRLNCTLFRSSKTHAHTAPLVYGKQIVSREDSQLLMSAAIHCYQKTWDSLLNNWDFVHAQVSHY